MQSLGEKYQGIILFTVQRLYLWSIVAKDDTTAKTLRDTILDVVNTLELNQTDVICVCTDNSKANIAAFDEKYPHHEYQHFIRVPCSAHTADLAIKDIHF